MLTSSVIGYETVPVSSGVRDRSPRYTCLGPPVTPLSWESADANATYFPSEPTARMLPGAVLSDRVGLVAPVASSACAGQPLNDVVFVAHEIRSVGGR